MAVQYETASDGFISVLVRMNYFFTAVFILECIMKIIAYGWKYFNNGWNKFDFFVVLSSIIDIYIDQFSAATFKYEFLSSAPQLVRVLKVLRVSRILRLIGKYEGL